MYRQRDFLTREQQTFCVSLLDDALRSDRPLVYVCVWLLWLKEKETEPERDRERERTETDLKCVRTQRQTFSVFVQVNDVLG